MSFPATSPISSRLVGVQKQLQHNMTTDRVGHLLEQRSDIDNLQQNNILKNIRVAPSLQGTQKNLELNLAKSNLYHALKHRPTRYELQNRGVYIPTEYEQEHEYSYQQSSSPTSQPPSQRSTLFHFTRLLLKFVASMSSNGEISFQQKGYLKDLIIDQDSTILSIVQLFDQNNDVQQFKQNLILLSSRNSK
jgi:hypothetical protein